MALKGLMILFIVKASLFIEKVHSSNHHFTSSNPCVEFYADNNGKWDLIDGYDDEEINAEFAEYNGIATTTTTQELLKVVSNHVIQ